MKYNLREAVFIVGIFIATVGLFLPYLTGGLPMPLHIAVISFLLVIIGAIIVRYAMFEGDYL